MQMDNQRELYIDLLKRTLCGAVYDDLPVPIEVCWSRRGYAKKIVAAVSSRVARLFGASVGLKAHYTKEQIENGEIWPVQAMSMIGLKRMQNVQDCLTTVLSENIPGDFIETGVWRGGACIFARGIFAAWNDTTRRVFVADSFQGLPKPDADKYPDDQGDAHHDLDYLRVSKEQVARNFERFNLLDDRVVFLNGWFNDTLPTLPSEQLAVIRLDGDMYESTMDGFNNLYHKLSPGGFCIIDDYFLPNCAKAVQDYRTQHNITEEIVPIDKCGVYWRKNK